MARPSLVLDASVGVKWFSAKGEEGLAQSLAIRDRHLAGDLQVAVPELFYYEVTNALVNKKHIPLEAVELAVNSLFDVRLVAFGADRELFRNSGALARQSGITIYDACYLALARELGCPLVTANPRHQRPDLGCKVISIEDWGS